MKVLILTNNDMGLYKFRRELLECLISDGHEVCVSVPHGEFSISLENIGCKLTETKMERRGTNPLCDIYLFLQYLTIIKRTNADIVLTYTVKPNIYGGIACIFLRKRYVANITGLGTAVGHAGILRKFIVAMYKIAFLNVQTIFLQNKKSVSFFQDNKVAVDRLKLLPGSGVNLEQFTLLEYPSGDMIEFVFISRIMKEKGIDQYLHMAKYIREKYPCTRFHICGFCEEKYEAVLREYEENGILTYHGLVMDVRGILQVTHCTVHPSYYPEGISNVLLESAASGRPIITTDHTGCREVVEDGVNGFLVPKKDEQALISAVERFLELTNKERSMMGVAGRKKVEREFDRRSVVDAYKREIIK